MQNYATVNFEELKCNRCWDIWKKAPPAVFKFFWPLDPHLQQLSTTRCQQQISASQSVSIHYHICSFEWYTPHQQNGHALCFYGAHKSHGGRLVTRLVFAMVQLATSSWRWKKQVHSMLWTPSQVALGFSWRRTHKSSQDDHEGRTPGCHACSAPRLSCCICRNRPPWPSSARAECLRAP